MMEQTMKYIKLFKDYGVNAVLIVVVVWMNNRVSHLEDKLFACYEARITERVLTAGKDIEEGPVKQFAVLVQGPRIKKAKDEVE